MSDKPDDNNQILIYDADRRLKAKLGAGLSFSQVVTPAVIAQAQEEVAKSSDKILQQNMEHLEVLEKLLQEISHDAPATDTFQKMSAAAFSIKSNAGMCGYGFASALGRSLQLFCEALDGRDKKISTTEREIISCHINGIKTAFVRKITGDGGIFGQTIADELEQLTVRYRKS